MGSCRAHLPIERWPARSRRPVTDWESEWASMVVLRSELDQIEYDQELEASHDDGHYDFGPCQWCGLPLSNDEVELALWTLGFSLKDYWGPLQFDESDRHQWRVGLFISDAWRWMNLQRPLEPGGRYEVSQPLCSSDCCDAFMRALRRDTAARRPQ